MKYTDIIAGALFEYRCDIINEDYSNWNICDYRNFIRTVMRLTKKQFNDATINAGNNEKLERDIVAHMLTSYVHNLDLEEWKMFFKKYICYINIKCNIH